jgi:nicotinamide-nucleotide adenylyltransferase
MTLELSQTQQALDHLQSSDNETRVEILYTSHPSWPLERPASQSREDSTPVVTIGILDSSFNPPTLAHLALAQSSPSASERPGFDARLLLVSVRNADKKLKPGDATYAQRLQMMRLLAADMEERDPTVDVAVAAIDEPTFVGKSSVLRSWLGKRLEGFATASAAPPRQVELTFILGYDTVTRLFYPKFYGSVNNMKAALHDFFDKDGSSVVYARRDASDEEEQAFISSENVRDWAESGKVGTCVIGEGERKMSSTLLRQRVSGEKDDGRWDVLCTQRIADYIRDRKLYASLGNEPD